MQLSHNQSMQQSKPPVTPPACAGAAPAVFAVEAGVMQKGTDVRRFFIAILIALVATSAIAETAGTINVIGRSSTSVNPDRAAWRVTVNTRSPNSAEARRLCSEKTTEILTLAKQLGVADADVEIGKTRVDKIFDQDSNYNQKKFKYFSLNLTIIIYQRDMSQFERYFNAIVGDAESIVEVRYSVSRAAAITDSLRLVAVEDARDKAAAMAGVLGGTLGRPIVISEYRPADPGGDIRSAEDALSKQSGPLNFLSLPEAVTVSSTVYVTFALQ